MAEFLPKERLPSFGWRRAFYIIAIDPSYPDFLSIAESPELHSTAGFAMLFQGSPMANLDVENVAKDLYETFRDKARERHPSIATEALSLLEENVPSEKELKARRAFVRKLQRMHAKASASKRQFPSTEEMMREDRER